jgi:dTDP-4-dehydrorhamnose 3,5-epimerase
MIIHATPIEDLHVVEFEPLRDDRGFFARTFCAREFERRGLSATVAQANLAFNFVKGTVRGMHFQVPPAAETKLVRCTRGAIQDVVVDLRPESPTFLRHFSLELTQDSQKALYVPDRFAHGYQTLTDSAEVTYQVGEFYSPGYERGLRFSDPRLALAWPLEPTVVSEKDRRWPLLDDDQIAIVRRELSCDHRR